MVILISFNPQVGTPVPILLMRLLKQTLPLSQVFYGWNVLAHCS